MTTSPSKPTKKIDIYEADMPILQAFLNHIGEAKTEEGLRFAFNLMAEMADRIKSNNDYVKGKVENWKQAQLRTKLPFYG